MKLNKTLTICIAMSVLMACNPNAGNEVPTVDPAKYASLDCAGLINTDRQFLAQIRPLLEERETLKNQLRLGVAVGVVATPLGGALIGGTATQELRAIDQQIESLGAERHALRIAGRIQKCWD